MLNIINTSSDQLVRRLESEETRRTWTRRIFLRRIISCATAALLARPSRLLSAEVELKPIAILDAPSNLGLRPPRPEHEPGVWRLAAALRKRDIVSQLHAQDAGAVPRLPYSFENDEATGFRNGPTLARYTEQLSRKIGLQLEQDVFPLVLGGDCSILLGAALALRRRGRYGLCFIDGHNDFCYARDPKWRGRYTAAGLDLALATGHGPDALTNLEDLKPYVREEDVVALGFYEDPDPALTEFFAIEQFYKSKIQRLDAERIRKSGAEETAKVALESLERSDLKGFWIHVDTDVLHQSVMPAVDSPNPGGLTFEQLASILGVLLHSPKAVGMELTIFDPELDPKGNYAKALVNAMTSVFRVRQM
jgi:arginase